MLFRSCRQSNDFGTSTTTESCAVRPALQAASQFCNIAVIALKWRPYFIYKFFFFFFFTATNVYNININRGEHMFSEYAIHFSVDVLVIKLFAISLNIAARAVLMPFLGCIFYASFQIYEHLPFRKCLPFFCNFIRSSFIHIF